METETEIEKIEALLLEDIRDDGSNEVLINFYRHDICLERFDKLLIELLEGSAALQELAEIAFESKANYKFRVM